MKESNSPQDTGDPAETAARALAEKKKKRGLVGGLFLKVGEKVGIVEQTRLAPEFITELEKYSKYQDVADNVVEGLEGVLQMNPEILQTQKIECEHKKDPIELFGKAVKHMRDHVPRERLQQTMNVEAILKRMAILHRDGQVKGRRSIRRLRRFVATEYKEFIANHEQLINARDVMDAARHEVKQARTTEQVEQRGRIYEQAVHEFDELAGKLALSCDNLGTDRLVHEREILDWFEVSARHHYNMAYTLNETLAKMGVPGFKSTNS
ncbi:unnamed protein product [Bursaphelenchus xylophilus]|uniref:(pine wood nematode) hypothetical protein n=1 Tax=Bursaphelenchus xylophilus TaxID=6326 RepID=A0A1I7SMN5_BURXY|nr:unnamed protein product [Bursaphelenchus xylophilus]CAG9130297.1 unnamed protein product [Bursaphelenchus xylophilus]